MLTLACACWAYASYSGKHRQLAKVIERGANALWGNVSIDVVPILALYSSSGKTLSTPPVEDAPFGI